MEQLPRYQELIPTLVKVLSAASGPMTNSEIELAVIEELSIPARLVEVIHSGKRTELQYRLGWARTKAKSDGLILSPARETWSTSQA
jgi:restriction endonuclease Mrr